jgi:hypothetical protein
MKKRLSLILLLDLFFLIVTHTAQAAAVACANNGTIACALEQGRSSNDPEFIASNIANGVNILGVTGTLASSTNCTPPSSCSTIGSVCSDGSLFAGFMAYNNGSCVPLYVTNNNQSTASVWKTSTGTNDITPDSMIDGRANHTNRSGTLSDFPAFQLCQSNTYHGKSDWYLPSRMELNLLWLNRAAINANAAGSFIGPYWSSSEISGTSEASHHDFSLNYQKADISKTWSPYDVRCVRRD